MTSIEHRSNAPSSNFKSYALSAKKNKNKGLEDNTFLYKPCISTRVLSLFIFRDWKDESLANLSKSPLQDSLGIATHTISKRKTSNKAQLGWYSGYYYATALGGVSCAQYIQETGVICIGFWERSNNFMVSSKSPLLQNPWHFNGSIFHLRNDQQWYCSSTRHPSPVQVIQVISG